MKISRRQMVFASASLLAVGAVSAQWPGSAAFAAQPAANADIPAEFLTLSTQLTGIAQPDSELAQRLYRWLYDQAPEVDKNVSTLSVLLKDNASVHGPDLLTLILAQPPEVTDLYHSFMSGWYLGVVGKPTSLTCIGFENIVSYRVLSSSFTPPSYCLGETNFWTRPPRQEALANA